MAGEQDVGFGHQPAQDRRRVAAPRVPQLGTEVAVERHLHACRACRPHRSQDAVGRLLTERRRHAGHVQPVPIRQQRRPVVRAATGTREDRVRAVVEHFARPLDGARRQEVQAHAPCGLLHGARIHAMPAQLAQRGFAQRVVRHQPDHARIVAEARQRHGDVRFRATDMHVEHGRLQQHLSPGCTEAQQQLTKTDDRSHFPSPVAWIPRAAQAGLACPWGQD